MHMYSGWICNILGKTLRQLINIDPGGNLESQGAPGNPQDLNNRGLNFYTFFYVEFCIVLICFDKYQVI